jgi:hypothetical protein
MFQTGLRPTASAYSMCGALEASGLPEDIGRATLFASRLY